MTRAKILLTLTAILAVGACSGNPSPETGASAVSQQADAAARSTGRWAGTFQPQRSRVGGLAPTNRRATYGTVSVVPVNGNPGRMRIRIDMSSDERFATQLAWGIYPGRCGAGTALASPTITPSSLEKISIVSGKAQILTEVALELDDRSTYHINVFRDQVSADQSAVIACANIRPE